MKKSNNLLLLTASACAMGMYAKPNTPEKPNIVLLFADDLGWNDISSPIATLGNGSKNHQTPNIDRLAEQSMVFANAYTQQNSAPTRAALLTGQYANRTHVYNVWGLDRYSKGNQPGIKEEDARIIPAQQEVESIKPGTLTYARLLSEAGYHTYIFGKVHGFRLNENDNCGFTDNFECSKKVKIDKTEASNYFAFKTKEGEWIFNNPLYNKFAQPYSEGYIRKNLLPYANGNNPLTLIGTKKHYTDAIGDVVIDEISKVDTKKPFLMWVAFNAIHSAIVGRDDLYEKYKKRTELDPRHENFKYAALTEQLDQTVGRILAALDDPNGDGDCSDSMRDNTVVIFMSDNGGVDGGKHSNAPLRGAKGMQYEGGIRVPMIVRYPPLIKPHTVTIEPVHVIDFLPTFIDLAGIKYTHKEHVLDGESFLPLLSGKSTTLKRDRLFWHFPGYMDERGIPASVINKRIGDKRYKYRYCYEFDTHELYNLTDDIGEKVNLLSDKPSALYRKIGNELLTDLNQWIDNTKPLPMYYVGSHKLVVLPKEVK